MSNLFKKIVLSFFILMLVLLCAAVAVAQFLKLQKQAEAIKTQKQAELVLKGKENELEKKINDLEEEIAKITHQSETAKRSAAQRIEAQTQGQQEKIKNLQDSLASLEKERIALIRQASKAKKEKEQLKHERDKMAKESSKNLIKQQEDLNKERQRDEKSKQELELRLAKASGEKEIKELKEKISSLNQGNAKTSSSLNEANAQIKALNQQLNQVKTELKDASKQNEDASKQNKELILEAEKLKISNQQIRAQFSPLQQLNNQLEKKAGELYIQAQDAKQIPSFQNAIETLTRERGVLADRIKDLEVELEKINKSRAAQLRDLAWAYMKIKEFAQAIDFYSQSLSFDPQNSEAHYRLGLLYERKEEDVKKSIFHLKRYLALDPKTTKRQEVEYMINMLSANGPNKWRKP